MNRGKKKQGWGEGKGRMGQRRGKGESWRNNKTKGEENNNKREEVELEKLKGTQRKRMLSKYERRMENTKKVKWKEE